jgi:site-specific DNA recombinase
MMTQLAGFAEYEKDIIRERCMSGRRKWAEQGQQPSRTQSPFGYHIVTRQDVLRGEYTADLIGHYIIVPEEASIARELFTRYAQGQSLRGLTLWLKTSGVATRRSGKNWHPSTVKYLLLNPVYKGAPIFGRFHWRTDESRTTKGLNPVYQRRATEDNWVRLQCEPLVNEALWNRVQERLAENQAIQSGPSKRRHLLSGLMVCAVCNRRMRSSPTKRGGLYYQCPEGNLGKGYSGLVCVNKTHRAEVVEALILRDIRFLSRQTERFASALRTFHKKQQKGRGPEQEICRLQQALNELERQEDATARAQVDALAKGRGIEVHERLLSDIDRNRKQTQTRLSELMAERPPINMMDLDTDAERIAEVLRRMDDVLTNSEATPVEKNQVLSTLIRAIRPEGDGYSLELRSASDCAQGLLSVQMISIHCPPGASR